MSSSRGSVGDMWISELGVAVVLYAVVVTWMLLVASLVAGLVQGSTVKVYAMNTAAMVAFLLVVGFPSNLNMGTAPLLILLGVLSLPWKRGSTATDEATATSMAQATAHAKKTALLVAPLVVLLMMQLHNRHAVEDTNLVQIRELVLVALVLLAGIRYRWAQFVRATGFRSQVVGGLLDLKLVELCLILVVRATAGNDDIWSYGSPDFTKQAFRRNVRMYLLMCQSGQHWMRGDCWDPWRTWYVSCADRHVDVTRVTAAEEMAEAKAAGDTLLLRMLYELLFIVVVPLVLEDAAEDMISASTAIKARWAATAADEAVAAAPEGRWGWKTLWTTFKDIAVAANRAFKGAKHKAGTFLGAVGNTLSSVGTALCADPPAADSSAADSTATDPSATDSTAADSSIDETSIDEAIALAIVEAIIANGSPPPPVRVAETVSLSSAIH